MSLQAPAKLNIPKPESLTQLIDFARDYENLYDQWLACGGQNAHLVAQMQAAEDSFAQQRILNAMAKVRAERAERKVEALENENNALREEFVRSVQEHEGHILGLVEEHDAQVLGLELNLKYVLEDLSCVAGTDGKLMEGDCGHLDEISELRNEVERLRRKEIAWLERSQALSNAVVSVLAHPTIVATTGTACGKLGSVFDELRQVVGDDVSCAIEVTTVADLDSEMEE